MGVMTTLQQDAVRRKEKNMKDLENEVKHLQKKAEEKEEQKQFEKDLKIALKNELYMLFYEQFENNLKNNISIKKIYNNFLTIESRNNTINSITTKACDIMYLNDIYKRTLKQVYEIFEDDTQAKKQPTKLQELQGFYNFINEQNRNTLKYEQQDTKKEQKKNGFILFLNMIFSFWSK